MSSETELERAARCLLQAGLNTGVAVIGAWMGARGYATGDGKTIEQLLSEIEMQAQERVIKHYRERVR